MSTLKKVLYTEDDASIQLVATMALKDIGGMEVQVCSSGQEAIYNAATFEPNLLLLDVVMPGLDGPATLKALRKLKATATTPAIFMTAKSNPDEIEKLMKLADVIGVISKPFDPMTLAEQVRQTWNEHQ
ncbi:MAG: response regulator [Chromatiales bacterium]|nr:response regulator [Chromatiales bacterium]